jgi:hypothetical protein
MPTVASLCDSMKVLPSQSSILRITQARNTTHTHDTRVLSACVMTCRRVRCCLVPLDGEVGGEGGRQRVGQDAAEGAAAVRQGDGHAERGPPREIVGVAQRKVVHPKVGVELNVLAAVQTDPHIALCVP